MQKQYLIKEDIDINYFHLSNLINAYKVENLRKILFFKINSILVSK
jgi:hypothetical protein